MSYSFGVTASSKEEARKKVAAEMDKVVAGQPIHAKDRAGACAAVDAFIDALKHDTSKDITLSVSGSVYYSGEDVLGGNLSVSYGQAERNA